MIDILLSNMKKIRLPATDLWQTTTTPSIYTSRPQRKKKEEFNLLRLTTVTAPGQMPQLSAECSACPSVQSP